MSLVKIRLANKFLLTAAFVKSIKVALVGAAIPIVEAGSAWAETSSGLFRLPTANEEQHKTNKPMPHLYLFVLRNKRV
jgi:hypothetical protein